MSLQATVRNIRPQHHPVTSNLQISAENWKNGRVRSRWGQIRFWLPFAVFLTCTITPDWYQVYST